MVGVLLSMIGANFGVFGAVMLASIMAIVFFSGLMVVGGGLFDLGVVGMSLSWVSCGLLVLSFLVLVMIGGSLCDFKLRVGLWFLFLGLFGVFIADSWFKFYIFYEGVVFPLFLFILLYGGYYERVYSGFYLLLYTVGLSMPLGVYVLWVVSGQGGWGLAFYYSSWVVMCGVWMAMLVKVPVYGLHGWLPKVHVEASTVGSMVLASVMIKLGVYGGYLLVVGGASWNPHIVVWWLLGGLSCLCLCVSVSDMKGVIAYSSVVHMAVVGYLLVVGLVGVSRGVLLVSWAHGVVALSLFYIIGGLGAEMGSRCIVNFMGVIGVFSATGLLVMMLLVLNMGFPLSAGFLGELECFWCIVVESGSLGVLVVCFFIVLGCCFNLYLGVVMSGFFGYWEMDMGLVMVNLVCFSTVLLLLWGNLMF